MLKLDWNILFILINLVIFYLLMKKFFFKPIISTMDKRKEMLEKQFKDAEEVNTKALELKKEYEDKIQNAQEESARIISDAKESAKTEYGKILDKAENDAEKIKQTAKKASDAERETIIRSAKEDIASLAMEAAEKIVGANVSDKTNSQIFDEFLNEGSEE